MRQHQAIRGVLIDTSQLNTLVVEHIADRPGTEEHTALEARIAQKPGTAVEHRDQHISQTPLL